MSFDWNSDVIARLRSLWESGLPFSQIGRELGISKGAVLGKVSRLGWPARQPPIVKVGDARPLRMHRVTRSSEQNRRASLISSLPPVVPVVSLENTCQWIDGAPSRHATFCDAPTQPGSSFCPAHHARCWIAPTPRQPNPEIGLVPVRDGRADDRGQAFPP